MRLIAERVFLILHSGAIKDKRGYMTEACRAATIITPLPTASAPG